MSRGNSIEWNLVFSACRTEALLEKWRKIDCRDRECGEMKVIEKHNNMNYYFLLRQLDADNPSQVKIEKIGI